MKTLRLLTHLVMGAMLPGSLFADPFDSGSNGSYGPLNVTEWDTEIQLPPDGILHCTTVNISSSASVKFLPNALNTPAYILATGDVLIQGLIDVSGKSYSGALPGRGGPGGFAGGYGGVALSDGSAGPGGAGLGPGGGFVSDVYHFGLGVFGNKVDDGDPGTGPELSPDPYGNASLVPLIGGSGGAGGSGSPGYGGGGGGGAILIASNTKVSLTGYIYAYGGSGGRGGSGGGVRLVAPIVDGSGYIYAYGGGTLNRGRIRIDCPDRYSHRSLNTQDPITRGTNMNVFPSTVPKLSIVEAAGQTIAEGTGGLVEVNLPVGSATSRTVVLRGRDFTGIVPVVVQVTPENAAAVTYNGSIDMNGQPTAETTVNVTIPAGTTSRIMAWTE